jgi:hypothetical protein
VDGGERREFQERRATVEEPLDAIANRKLSLRSMSLDVFGAAPFTRLSQMLLKLVDEMLHPFAVGLKDRIGGINLGLKHIHRGRSIRLRDKRRLTRMTRDG